MKELSNVIELMRILENNLLLQYFRGFFLDFFTLLNFFFIIC